MRYKYIGRLYHSGLLEQIVELLNTTGEKRKRSKDQGLPDPKRKSMNKTEADSALTDYDSDQGDSSDEEQEEEVNQIGDESLAKEEKDTKSKFKDSIFHGSRYARHHVSTQTHGPLYLY